MNTGDEARASFFCSVTLLLILAHRLPAPISEEKPSPTPETEKLKTAAAKHKSVESSDSNSARRFDGTWKGTLVSKIPTAVYTISATLIIRDGKTADITNEVTSTLPRGGSWSNSPDAYRHLSPLYQKITNHSDHLVAEGFDLMIRWSGRRLVDWAPKTLTLEEAQKLGGMDKPAENASALTLKGEELVYGKFVFHRVK